MNASSRLPDLLIEGKGIDNEKYSRSYIGYDYYGKVGFKQPEAATLTEVKMTLDNNFSGGLEDIKEVLRAIPANASFTLILNFEKYTKLDLNDFEEIISCIPENIKCIKIPGLFKRFKNTNHDALSSVFAAFHSSVTNIHTESIKNDTVEHVSDEKLKTVLQYLPVSVKTLSVTDGYRPRSIDMQTFREKNYFPKYSDSESFIPDKNKLLFYYGNGEKKIKDLPKDAGSIGYYFNDGKFDIHYKTDLLPENDVLIKDFKKNKLLSRITIPSNSTLISSAKISAVIPLPEQVTEVVTPILYKESFLVSDYIAFFNKLPKTVTRVRIEFNGVALHSQMLQTLIAALHSQHLI